MVNFHERAYDSMVLSPPEVEIVAECGECGYEIARNEVHINVGDTILCYDDDCFTRYAKKVLDYQETTI